MFSIVYSLYRFLAWEDTRNKILSMEKLLSLILKLLKSPNNKIVFIVMNFLDIIQLFEPMHSEKVKKKKFKIYNKEFIKYVDSIEKNEMEYDEN